ncbi:hypothetical protein KCW65_29325, partial [Mycobacterium tuberculosis]|nr:hypothetical protein [Mycobacterium tuberculosis]
MSNNLAQVLEVVRGTTGIDLTDLVDRAQNPDGDDGAGSGPGAGSDGGSGSGPGGGSGSGSGSGG